MPADPKLIKQQQVNKPDLDNKISHLGALTARQVRWARAQHALGKDRKRILKKLGISHTALSFLLRGKTYQHVK